MASYVARRLLQLIPLLVGISIISFAIIELPPGDYLTTYVIQLEQSGTTVAEEEVARLTQQYGLDKPLYVRYARWMWNIVRYGNWGRSFQWQKPVSDVLGERIALTMAVSICTLAFVYVVSIPIGIYVATHQYSPLDFFFTFIGFIGLAIPNFLLALVVIWLAHIHLNITVTGLFSPDYAEAPWTLAKLLDMLKRLWVPVVVIGMAGTASLIRVIRATMLDELGKPYVMTARAKGVSESRLLLKYPVRLAINPIISTVGWLLPTVVSGEAITSIVLNLPTTGPVLVRALLYQDMYLAGSFVMILSVLTVVGTLISDIALAWVDPRIRYERVTE